MSGGEVCGDPATIGSQLDALFVALDRGEITHRRCAGGNVLEVVMGRAKLKANEPLINALAESRPSRFFRVCIEDSAKAMEISVSARCHGLSQNEQACAELVEILVPGKSLAAIPSILRANLLGGMPTAAFLMDADVPRETVNDLVAIVDEVIFDSALFERRVDVLRDLSRASATLVDLEWIALGGWREGVRMAGARPEALHALASLEEIEVRTSSENSPLRWGISSLLMAGWLLRALGLVPATHGDNRIVCVPHPRSLDHSVAQPRHEVQLRFVGGVGRGAATLVGVALKCATGVEIVAERRVSGGRGTLEVALRRREGTHPQVLFRETRALDSDSEAALLERYYSVGESLTNFQGALSTALTLANRG